MSQSPATSRPRPLLAVLIVLVLAATLVGVSHGSATAAVDSSRADAAQFTRLVNRARASHGRHALIRHRQLDALATAHSKRMGRQANSDGRCNDSRHLRHRKPISGGVTAPWTALGENVGYECNPAASDRQGVNRLHGRLMASPGHRRNILNPRMRHVGIGTYRDADGGLWVTQIFMDTD